MVGTRVIEQVKKDVANVTTPKPKKTIKATTHKEHKRRGRRSLEEIRKDYTNRLKEQLKVLIEQMNTDKVDRKEILRSCFGFLKAEKWNGRINTDEHLMLIDWVNNRI